MTGWYSVNVTSYPDKIHDALAASLAVLRDLRASRVTARELMRAKRTLITRWGGGPPFFWEGGDMLGGI